jgi:hypothetical protein
MINISTLPKTSVLVRVVVPEKCVILHFLSAYNQPFDYDGIMAENGNFYLGFDEADGEWKSTLRKPEHIVLTVEQFEYYLLNNQIIVNEVKAEKLQRLGFKFIMAGIAILVLFVVFFLLFVTAYGFGINF